MTNPGRQTDADASERTDAWFRLGPFALLLALILVAAFSRVFFGAESFFFRDFGIFGYPLAWHHAVSFWRGELPLWNPYNNCGLPFLAQWNTLVLYPGSLIYLLLPLPWSLNFFCLAHLFLGGLGMYILARRWTGSSFAACVAGMAFALNGLMLSSLKWPNNIAVLGWMPWVVWLVERAWRERGRIWPAALAGATQMLAGTPELILMTWFLLAALWLGQCVGGSIPRKAMAARFLGVILIVALLCSAQLLPFLQLLSESQRGSQFGAVTWSMPWWGLANFLVPLFRCVRSYQGVFTQYDQYWISSYYTGVGLLIVALWGVWRVRRRRVWLLAGLALFFLLLASGETGGVYRLLHWMIPPLGFMRFPIKFVSLVLFLLPLLAAFAVAHWESLPADARPRAAKQLLVLGALALLAIVALLVIERLYPGPADDWPATWKTAAWRGVFLLVMGVCLWASERAVLPRKQALMRLALLMLMAVDVLTHAPWQNPTVPLWTTEPGLAEVVPRPTLGVSRAMMSPASEAQLDHWMPDDPVRDYTASRLGLFCNCNLLDQIPKVDGFYSLYLDRTALFVRTLYGATNASYPRLNAFLGVSQLTAENRMVFWYEQTNNLPLITAGQRPVFASGNDAFKAMTAPDFASQETLFLPLEARSSVTATNRARARVISSRWTTHEVEAEVEAAQPAWVVVAQSFYPCWRAYVDRRPAALWRANVAFQAVEVPAGRSHVRWVYEDTRTRMGLGISIATFLLGSVQWLRTRHRSG